jgi:hypothetical protein
MRKILIVLLILLFLCTGVGFSFTQFGQDYQNDQGNPGIIQGNLSNQSNPGAQGILSNSGNLGYRRNHGIQSNPGDQGNMGNQYNLGDQGDLGNQDGLVNQDDQGEYPMSIPAPEFPSAILPAAFIIVFLGTVMLIRWTAGK